jgi:hypothetical protein
MSTQFVQKFDNTSFVRNLPEDAGIGVVDGVLYINVDGTPTPVASQAGATAAYPGTTAGVQTLLTAVPYDRIVTINVRVTTVFADGDGAQPVFIIGPSSNDDGFLAATVLVDAAAGTNFNVAGLLPADETLIVTATAGTGTTETGAIAVTAVTVPST